MTRLQEAALAIVCGLAGAFLAALIFAACDDPAPHVRIPAPTLEYTP